MIPILLVCSPPCDRHVGHHRPAFKSRLLAEARAIAAKMASDQPHGVDAQSFVEMVIHSLGQTVSSCKGRPPTIGCPLRLYQNFCARPCCATEFQTYGAKLMRHQWRSHVQAHHTEDVCVLHNLCEDLQAAALFEWLNQPESERLYLRPITPSTPPPAPDAQPQPQHEGDAVKPHAPPAAAAPAAAASAAAVPVPCLACPYACGVSQLQAGAEFAAHLVVWHLKELQTLGALLDSLVLRALKEQACPWENCTPSPCRVGVEPGAWWQHIHKVHVVDALATTLHVFRRGEVAVEQVLSKARRDRRSPGPLMCPMPHCHTSTTSALHLIQHLLLHIKCPAAHPAWLVEELLVRSDSLATAAAAAATAAGRQLQAKPLAKGSTMMHVIQGKDVVGQVEVGKGHTKAPSKQVSGGGRAESPAPAATHSPSPPKARHMGGAAEGLRCPVLGCSGCGDAHAQTGADKQGSSPAVVAFATIQKLEEHMYGVHEETLQSVAMHVVQLARVEKSTGALMCPVRSMQRPGANSADPTDTAAAAHHAFHRDAPSLVSHVVAHHTPALSAIVAFAKGLSGEVGPCPVCPAWATHPFLLGNGHTALDHLLHAHPVQLLQVVHCLQMLAAGGDSVTKATSCACLLGCGTEIRVKASDGVSLKAAVMLHMAEAHASHVLELSASAAAAAVPPNTSGMRSAAGHSPGRRANARTTSPPPHTLRSSSVTAAELLRSCVLMSTGTGLRSPARTRDSCVSPRHADAAGNHHLRVSGAWGGGGPHDLHASGVPTLHPGASAQLVGMHTGHRGDGGGGGGRYRSEEVGGGTQTLGARGVGARQQLTQADAAVQANVMSTTAVTQQFLRHAMGYTKPAAPAPPPAAAPAPAPAAAGNPGAQAAPAPPAKPDDRVDSDRDGKQGGPREGNPPQADAAGQMPDGSRPGGGQRPHSPSHQRPQSNSGAPSVAGVQPGNAPPTPSTGGASAVGAAPHLALQGGGAPVAGAGGPPTLASMGNMSGQGAVARPKSPPRDGTPVGHGRDTSPAPHGRDGPPPPLAKDGPTPPHGKDGPAPPYGREGPPAPYGKDGPPPPHGRDGPPATHGRDTSPATHSKDGPAPPYGRDGPPAPYGKDGPPATHGRDTSPAPHGKDGPAPPYGRDGPPAPHGKDGPPPPHGRDGPPATHGRDTSPAPHGKDGTAPPYGRDGPAAQYGKDGPAPPYGRDGPPATYGRDGSPAPHGKDGPPPPHGRDGPPAGRDVSPAAHTKDGPPHGKDAPPAAHGRDISPAAHGRDTSPAPHGRDTSHAPHGKDVSHASHGRDASPVQGGGKAAQDSRSASPAPSSRDAPPSGRDAPPSGRDAPPSSRDAPPSGRDAPPSSRDAPPSSRDTPPSSRDTPPSSRDTPPSSRDTPPSSRDTPPSSRDAPPSGRDAPPSSRDAPPSSRDTPPSSRDTPPSSRDTPPSSRDAPPGNTREPMPPPAAAAGGAQVPAGGAPSPGGRSPSGPSPPQGFLRLPVEGKTNLDQVGATDGHASPPAHTSPRPPAPADKPAAASWLASPEKPQTALWAADDVLMGTAGTLAMPSVEPSQAFPPAAVGGKPGEKGMSGGGGGGGGVPDRVSGAGSVTTTASASTLGGGISVPHTPLSGQSASHTPVSGQSSARETPAGSGASTPVPGGGSTPPMGMSRPSTPPPGGADVAKPASKA